jgi:CPA2 family monovalent cation:H+ antiporter-2
VADAINIPVYSDALVVLGTAGIVVPLLRRFGVNPILGYLGAGAALGPLGLGSFVDELPPLYWLTVVDAANVASIAQLGVVFLLFLIGLELSFARLMTMRRSVFGLGMTQVVVTAVVLSVAIALMGQDPAPAAILGACLALSSTAIGIELLSSQGRLHTAGGRSSFAILLAQDLAVVPILLLVAVLAVKGDVPIATSLVSALGQAAAALAVIVLLGRTTLRPLYRLVASANSSELLLAVTLFVIVGTGVLAAMAGVSMALGAFVAGLLLAETEYRKVIETIIEPFKALLLGIFFFTVGMSIDVREIAREPLLVLGGIAALVVLKSAILYALSRAFGYARPAAIETAALLGPAGEFAFVGIGAALVAGVVDGTTAGYGLTVASLSMALIPALSALGRRAAQRLTPEGPADPELSVAPAPEAGATIVVGHGRVGKVVCALLGEHGRPFLAVDLDAVGVSRDRRQGHAVYYGDASNASFLKSCGIADASALIITLNNADAIDAVVDNVRRMRPDIPIFSRARDAAHARHLYGLGVTDAVPETIEASLQLSETALVGIGVPTGLVIASIHGKRGEFREELQAAARRSQAARKE